MDRALFGVCVFVLNRRAANIAGVKAGIERTMATVLRADRENDVALVESIVAGGPIDQCLSRFGAGRMKLFPAAHLDDSAWTVENLEAWKRQKLSDDIEAVNRGLAVPAFSAAIVIVALCVVAVGVLYSFRSSQSPQVIPGPGSLNVGSGPAALPPADTLPLPVDAPTVLAPQPASCSPDSKLPTNMLPSNAGPQNGNAPSSNPEPSSVPPTSTVLPVTTPITKHAGEPNGSTGRGGLLCAEPAYG